MFFFYGTGWKVNVLFGPSFSDFLGAEKGSGYFFFLDGTILTFGGAQWLIQSSVVPHMHPSLRSDEGWDPDSFITSERVQMIVCVWPSQWKTWGETKWPAIRIFELAL